MKRLNKFIFVDTKKLKKRYRSRMFAVSVPFLQLNIVISLFVLFSSEKSHRLDYNIFMAKLILVGFGSLLVVLTAGVVISKHFISVHKKNTFIDITSKSLVVSRHSQTYFNKFKPAYYKKLHIINLSELQSINIVKGKIVIKGKVRTLYEKAEWLIYSCNENGICFDEWWFDRNAGTFSDGIEIPDLFLQTARVVKFVRRASSLEKERVSRRKKYHEKMLEMAKSSVLRKPTRPRGASYYQNNQNYRK